MPNTKKTHDDDEKPLKATKVDPSNAHAEDNQADLENREKGQDLKVKGTIPGQQKNNDPANEAKMKQIEHDSDAVVDPTVKGTVPTAHQNKKVSALPQNPVIKAISGRRVTVVGGNYGENKDGICYIAPLAEVTLNGEKTTLAGLDNGDAVILSGGKKNDRTLVFEYSKIEATRKVAE